MHNRPTDPHRRRDFFVRLAYSIYTEAWMSIESWILNICRQPWRIVHCFCSFLFCFVSFSFIPKYILVYKKNLISYCCLFFVNVKTKRKSVYHQHVIQICWNELKKQHQQPKHVYKSFHVWIAPKPFYCHIIPAKMMIKYIYV